MLRLLRVFCGGVATLAPTKQPTAIYKIVRAIRCPSDTVKAVSHIFRIFYKSFDEFKIYVLSIIRAILVGLDVPQGFVSCSRGVCIDSKLYSFIIFFVTHSHVSIWYINSTQRLLCLFNHLIESNRFVYIGEEYAFIMSTTATLTK